MLHVQDDRAPLHEVCRSQSVDELGLATIVYMLVTAGAHFNDISTNGQEVITDIFTAINLYIKSFSTCLLTRLL